MGRQRFFIPAYFILALLVGASVGALDVQKRVGFARRPLAIGLAGAFAAAPLAANYYGNDKSSYYFAYDFAMNTLQTLERNAIYFPTADHATFPVLYLQAAEGMRPDVTLANKYGYPEAFVYEAMPLSIRSTFKKFPNQSEEELIEDWVVTNSSRPVYFTKKRGFPNLSGVNLANAGLLYRVTRADEDWRPPNLWERYRWTTLRDEDGRGDLTAGMILSDYHFARGRDVLAKGRTNEALDAFEACLRIGGENKELLNNIGSVYAENGILDAAAGYYQRAVNVDPDYDLAVRNLAQAFMESADYEKAAAYFDRLAKMNKATYHDLMCAVDCRKKLGQLDQAEDILQDMIRRDPKDDALFREVGNLYLNERNQPHIAMLYFAQSLALNPNQPDLQFLMARGYDPYSPMPELPSLGPEIPMPEFARPLVPELPRPAP